VINSIVAFLESNADSTLLPFFRLAGSAIPTLTIVIVVDALMLLLLLLLIPSLLLGHLSCFDTPDAALPGIAHSSSSGRIPATMRRC